MFAGAITALITPFSNNTNTIEEESFQSFVNWQIEEGIHGLVPAGTTGECATLSHEEHNRIIALCVEAANKRVPVIAGTGSNSTEEAIMLTRHAKDSGADAALIVTPYYNKPNQQGLEAHFTAIHDAVDIPIILYNIPGRSVVDMSDETIARLSKLERIVGIKDATGNLTRVSTTALAVNDSSFSLLSGDDGTAVSFCAQGGHGCISVTSNIAPKQVSHIQTLCKQGDYKQAASLHNTLITLHQALFIEPSPGAVKYSAQLLGLANKQVRLPLVDISEQGMKHIRHVMSSTGFNV